MRKEICSALLSARLLIPLRRIERMQLPRRRGDLAVCRFGGVRGPAPNTYEPTWRAVLHESDQLTADSSRRVSSGLKRSSQALSGTSVACLYCESPAW